MLGAGIVMSAPENTERFREQLRRQVAHLRNSSALYDAGQHHEALRIATTILNPAARYPHSVSLLTHLNAKRTVRLGSVAAPGPNGVDPPVGRGADPH